MKIIRKTQKALFPPKEKKLYLLKKEWYYDGLLHVFYLQCALEHRKYVLKHTLFSTLNANKIQINSRYSY